jgi:hypothetical protein
MIDAPWWVIALAVCAVILLIVVFAEHIELRLSPDDILDDDG